MVYSCYKIFSIFLPGVCLGRFLLLLLLLFFSFGCWVFVVVFCVVLVFVCIFNRLYILLYLVSRQHTSIMIYL